MEAAMSITKIYIEGNKLNGWWATIDSPIVRVFNSYTYKSKKECLDDITHWCDKYLKEGTYQIIEKEGE